MRLGLSDTQFSQRRSSFFTIERERSPSVCLHGVFPPSQLPLLFQMLNVGVVDSVGSVCTAIIGSHHFRLSAGLPTVEIVGFRGQTAPTTRCEIQTAPTTICVKTNYQPTGSTDSGAVLVYEEILLSGGGGGKRKIYVSSIISPISPISALLQPYQYQFIKPFDTKTELFFQRNINRSIIG